MECIEEAEKINDITGGKSAPVFYNMNLFLYYQFHF